MPEAIGLTGGPLQGITVLDLSRLLPGPFGSWLLRSWGARVIKVEEPDSGDYLREMQPLWFAHLNAGAESIALDLKRKRGQEILLRLCRRADGLIEGFRPGVLERLGLGWEQLHPANPRLVLISLGGYPAWSPMADRAGHDLTYLARSGLLSLFAEMPPVQIADLVGGLMAAAAGLAALVQARATGAGCHVQTSLFGSLVALGGLQAVETLAGRPPVRSEMALAGALPCYSLYETADGGQVALGALEAKFWRGFCAAVGRSDLLDRQLDPEVRWELEALFRSRTLVDWSEVAARHDICLEPVRTMGEAAHELRAAGLQPVAFDGQRPVEGGPAPRRGADTRRILLEAGLSVQEIEEAVAEAIVAP